MVLAVTEGKDPFFSARFFFIPAGTTKSGIKPVLVQRLLEPLGLPHIGVKRAMIKRINTPFQCFRVLVNKQFHPCISGGPVAQFIHGPEFPCRIDMQQRERRRRRENAFFARCSITALSLPTENSMTGFSALAATSRMM